MNPSPTSEQPTSATESTTVAYLDLSAEFASTLDASPTDSADSTHDAQGSSSTNEGEPWKLVRSASSHTGRAHEQHEPTTSDATPQPKGLTADEDVSEALELEAAGTMLASHGEPSSHAGATAQRGSDTSPTAVASDSASSLPSVTARDSESPDLQHSSAPGGTESVSTARDDVSEEARPSSPLATEAQAPTEATVVSLDAVRAANAESAGALIPGPSEYTTPVPPEPAPRPAATRRAPIELDDLPATDDAPMQLASTWEFVGWQGSDGNGTIGHVAESTWDDRAVDLDGTASRAAPAGASASELPLASAWDFIQQPWQPQAREQSEALTALLAASDAPTGTGSEGPAVSAEQVLTALEDVGTQGVLGKVLLAYCAGRFQRAFLLGESFGLVRVGHAWGPGSDSPQVSALKVDLEAPSLLMSSLGQLGPSSFDTPSCAQDEAIFSALGGPSSRLLVMPIRARGRPVAFVIADSGGEPVDTTTLDELTRVSAKASEVYDRLPASRAD
ncbi:general secretion pathway protein GspE [Myxococcus qinghaiensis]|uniref:general secretion pathway protein GspE n=1 Tax=Myxococcus qinghaiensis TaxID=2906758 RepID=UPI0020A7CF7E|nr:general secretion pathway protein GspE [Myxococcus qinghaiensis]MCP3161604.1 general secretion pathway protein GspE [Myxococcus qinghaiensis]